jgi:hypothetical protein
MPSRTTIRQVESDDLQNGTKVGKKEKLSVLRRTEEQIIERALRFAQRRDPVNVRNVRAISKEDGIEWPPHEYTLSLSDTRHGNISVLEVVTLKKSRLRPRKATGQAAKADAATIEVVRISLRKSLERIADFIEEEGVMKMTSTSFLAGGEGIVMTSSVEQMQVIAEMVQSPSGKLPAQVLAAYAVALLVDRPWAKYIRKCDTCEEVFLPSKTAGRRRDRHPYCDKAHRELEK